MATDPDHAVPTFCTLAIVLQGFFWAQLGSLLFVLGHGLPLDWALAGLVSIYAGWLSIVLVFAWCMLSNYVAPSLTSRRFGQKVFWLLLWLSGMLLAVLLAQLVYALGSSRYLPLLPIGVAHGPFLLSSALITAVLSGSLLRYQFMQQRWRQQQQQQARAELRNLQARVHPHFLFNTLNTIAALVEEQPEHAVAAIEDLGDLLRQSLAPRERLISLATEVDLARRYLRLMQWRLGERLVVNWNIGSAITDDARWQLPPLTLQVLLENAVLHGIQPSLVGGCIEVSAETAAQQLCLRVSNPLPPIASGATAASNTHTGTGTAISDLRRRLQLLFERPVSLQSHSSDGNYHAILQLPATRGGSAHD